jgi:hypothetical protein
MAAARSAPFRDDISAQLAPTAPTKNPRIGVNENTARTNSGHAGLD